MLVVVEVISCMNMFSITFIVATFLGQKSDVIFTCNLETIVLYFGRLSFLIKSEENQEKDKRKK